MGYNADMGFPCKSATADYGVVLADSERASLACILSTGLQEGEVDLSDSASSS
ncbi:hypothetical protein ACFOZ0_12840 [Streptomyces yaanensis]|uniref:Uncharacterized protein n=1 Tax=Streptomyces yaanensis TaxID=1142239 RepID=A0ABV7SAZ4_9ACTN|nr:hypothetical protein [Streptomyces sp. CGMCC 4.7035]WNC03352.1 hypothetical protein Q2K21_13455 [Streptomyces sp. CGMCC 4.7035]